MASLTSFVYRSVREAMHAPACELFWPDARKAWYNKWISGLRQRIWSLKLAGGEDMSGAARRWSADGEDGVAEKRLDCRRRDWLPVW